MVAVLGLQGVAAGFCTAASNVLVAQATSPGERALGFAAVRFMARATTLVVPVPLGWLMDVAGIRAVFAVGGLILQLTVVSLGIHTLRLGRGRGA